MSQKYGLTYPSYSGVKSGKYCPGAILFSKISATDTDGWDSEIDRSQQNPPQWTRKRSYISKLKKQNKKWFFNKNQEKKEKSYSLKKHTKEQPYSLSKHITEQPNSLNKHNKLSGYSEDGKLGEFNRYCVWNKYDKFKKKSQSLSRTSLLIKSSQEDQRKTPNTFIEHAKKDQIIGKFDQFSKNISKITGKVSSETLALIKEKITENLEAKKDAALRKNAACCSKKKTVSFIMKILDGASNKVPIYAPRRKKPQRKYNIHKLQGLRVRNKSALLSKLFDMKSKNKEKKLDVGTQCKNYLSSKRNAKKLHRSISEISEHSFININVVRSNSETNSKPFHKVGGLSNFELSKEGSSRLDDKLNILSKNPIYHNNLHNFKTFSSKNLVNLNQSPDTSDIDATDFGSSSTIISVKASTLSKTLMNLY